MTHFSDYVAFFLKLKYLHDIFYKLHGIFLNYVTYYKITRQILTNQKFYMAYYFKMKGLY